MPPQSTSAWEVWEKTDTWRPVAPPLRDQYPKRPPALRNGEEEARVAKRVEALWTARAANDYASIYDLLEPAYRAAVTREEFLARKARYLYPSFKVDWVEVEGSRARARVLFQQKLNDPTLYKLEPDDQRGIETWVQVDGQWFRAMERPTPTTAAAVNQ
jgi:hypothetical protein